MHKIPEAILLCRNSATDNFAYINILDRHKTANYNEAHYRIHLLGS